MESMNILSKLVSGVKKYRHAIIVLLIGMALMLLPTPGKADAKQAQTPVATQQTQEEGDLEQKLEQILSKISGAGEVKVLLTVRSGEENLYQTDTETDTDEASSRQDSRTVIVQDASRGESGLIRRTDPPVYQGALVVCQGGENPSVRLAIVEAVGCVTGLGADQITVVKMK